MLAELTRLNSHLVWLGTHAIDIGAMSVFLYCFREREEILRIFEMFSGPAHDDQLYPHRRTGAAQPPRGWQKRVKNFIDIFPSRVDEYEELLTNNRIWIGPNQGHRLHFARRHAGPGRHRAHAARRRAEDRCAQGRSVFELREVRFRSADAHRERRVRALPGAGIEEMRQSAEDHQAGARRNAVRDRIRRMRRGWCCPIAKR